MEKFTQERNIEKGELFFLFFDSKDRSEAFLCRAKENFCCKDAGFSIIKNKKYASIWSTHEAIFAIKAKRTQILDKIEIPTNIFGIEKFEYVEACFARMLRRHLAEEKLEK